MTSPLSMSRLIWVRSLPYSKRFRGVGGAPVFDEVDDAPADLVAGRVGLVFGLDFEPVGVGDFLDGVEDGAVVEGEVGHAGDGAGLDGADRPPGAFQCLGEAGFGVRVAVAFVLDIGAREFRDAAGAVGDGDGHACGAGGLGGLAQVFRPAAHRVLEHDAFVLVDLADGGDVEGVGAVGGSRADGLDGVGQVAERVAQRSKIMYRMSVLLDECEWPVRETGGGGSGEVSVFRPGNRGK